MITKDKQEIRINDMTNEHIENAINLIKNVSPMRGMDEKYLPKLEEEKEKRKDLL